MQQSCRSKLQRGAGLPVWCTGKVRQDGNRTPNKRIKARRLMLFKVSEWRRVYKMEQLWSNCTINVSGIFGGQDGAELDKLKLSPPGHCLTLAFVGRKVPGMPDILSRTGLTTSWAGGRGLGVAQRSRCWDLWGNPSLMLSQAPILPSRCRCVGWLGPS